LKATLKTLAVVAIIGLAIAFPELMALWLTVLALLVA
jgi:hypothetical protein